MDKCAEILLLADWSFEAYKRSARERAPVWRWEIAGRSYAYALKACLS